MFLFFTNKIVVNYITIWFNVEVNIYVPMVVVENLAVFNFITGKKNGNK